MTYSHQTRKVALSPPFVTRHIVAKLIAVRWCGIRTTKVALSPPFVIRHIIGAFLKRIQKTNRFLAPFVFTMNKIQFRQIQSAQFPEGNHIMPRSRHKSRPHIQDPGYEGMKYLYQSNPSKLGAHAPPSERGLYSIRKSKVLEISCNFL